MRLKEFLKSKTFLKHMAFIVLFFLVLTYLTLFLLKYYTYHGQVIKVPDLKGLSLNDADILTNEMILRHEIADSFFNLESVPGTVIDQYPAPGYQVKQKRTIYLTVASFTPEKVHVPKVTDVSLREAKSRLERAGLKTGQIIYRPSEFFNLVLSQLYEGSPIQGDTLLPKGSAIDLVVGRGLSNERTIVPDLSLMNLDEARAILYELNLNAGALVYDESVQTAIDSLYARIWKQSPLPSSDEMVELGTSIDIWFTIDDEKLFLTTDDPEE